MELFGKSQTLRISKMLTPARSITIISTQVPGPTSDYNLDSDEILTYLGCKLTSGKNNRQRHIER